LIVILITDILTNLLFYNIHWLSHITGWKIFHFPFGCIIKSRIESLPWAPHKYSFRPILERKGTKQNELTKKTLLPLLLLHSLWHWETWITLEKNMFLFFHLGYICHLINIHLSFLSTIYTLLLSTTTLRKSITTKFPSLSSTNSIKSLLEWANMSFLKLIGKCH